MTRHRFSVTHKDLEKLIAENTNLHKQEKFDNCYTLIGLLKHKNTTSNRKFNRVNLKKCELAHQITFSNAKYDQT